MKITKNEKLLLYQIYKIEKFNKENKKVTVVKSY